MGSIELIKLTPSNGVPDSEMENEQTNFYAGMFENLMTQTQAKKKVFFSQENFYTTLKSVLSSFILWISNNKVDEKSFWPLGCLS